MKNMNGSCCSQNNIWWLKMSLLRIISVLLLLLMTAGLAPPLRNVRAASSASNVIANGSFENGVNQQGIPSSWSFDSCEGVANATARVDASLHEDGASSAEISTGP